MKTVHQVSELTGVSVRTLHHYDAIDLLKPAAVTDAGYRLYDDASLDRLHSILMFRELHFPLKQIRMILDHPDYDRREALSQQIKLLELQKEHIEELIDSARRIMKEGVHTMRFQAFDKSKLEAYAAEAKERWSDTAAYRESQTHPVQEQEESGRAMMEIFAQFGSCGKEPASEEAQALVKKLQDFITGHYYCCTKEILSGLGQMYTADERFRENIDRAGGSGTAEFAAKAIEIYCIR